MTVLKTEEGRLGWIRSWLARRLGLSLGEWGEWVALAFLRRHQWDLLARNWRDGRGELDLIAYDGPYLVFVEVKTRRKPSLLPPEAQVGREKREQLRRLADRFRFRHELTNVPVRFDLIAIETGDERGYELRHYQGIEV